MNWFYTVFWKHLAAIKNDLAPLYCQCFPCVVLPRPFSYLYVHLWGNSYLYFVLLPVPVPLVSIFSPGVTSAYAGTQLTLVCSIFLYSSLFPVLGDLVVTSVWSDPGGGMLSSDGRVTVSPASQQGISTTFISTVMFNTLQASDAGTYTCEATVTPRGSTAGTVTNGVGSASTAIPTIECAYVCYLHNIAKHLTSVTSCHMFCSWNC